MRNKVSNSNQREHSPRASLQLSASQNRAKPHILMLVRNSGFPPKRNAPASRLGSFAKYWGCLTKVTVVSSNYYPPKGNYSRIQFPLTQYRLDFLRLPYRFPRLLRRVRDLCVDVVFVSFPYTWELLEAYLLAFRLRCPLIIDIRDLPTSQIPTYEGSFPHRLFNAFLQFVAYHICRKASRITTVTDCLMQDLIKILSCLPQVTYLIPNGSESALFEKALRIKKEFDLVFSGKFGHLENPLVLLRYLRRLADLYPPLRVLFISDFDSPPILGQKFLAGIASLGLNNHVVTKCMGPPENLPERLGRARLGLSSFAPGYIAHRGAVGAKVYEYLAAGLPVVGLMDPDFYVETGRLILDNKLGISHSNPERLAEKTATLLEHPLELKEMSNRARKIGERFDRRRLAEDYYYNVILPAWKEHNLSE